MKNKLLFFSCSPHFHRVPNSVYVHPEEKGTNGEGELATSFLFPCPKEMVLVIFCSLNGRLATFHHIPYTTHMNQGSPCKTPPVSLTPHTADGVLIFQSSLRLDKFFICSQT